MLADRKGLSASSLEGGLDLEERVFRRWEWRLNKRFDLHMHFALRTVSFHPLVPVHKDHESSSLLVGWRLGGRSQRNTCGDDVLENEVNRTAGEEGRREQGQFHLKPLDLRLPREHCL